MGKYRAVELYAVQMNAKDAFDLPHHGTFASIPSAGHYTELSQDMPFTPFHVGVAVFLKPALRLRFSVLIFCISQVAIDLEPLVRILRGDAQLHGWSHTVLGALAIGATSAWFGRPIANAWLRLLTRDGISAEFTSPISAKVALGSAWFGTGSHLVFDGIMHADMTPFAPLSTWNPLLGALPLYALHLGLIGAGVIGLLAFAVLDRGRAEGPT